MVLRVLLAIAVLAFGCVQAEAKRVALVMGNSEYQSFSVLSNPVNDAKLMEKALREVGFEVTLILNADQPEMKRAMLAFGRKLRKGVDASIFYYAGHGVQVKGKNYLIPIEASLEDEDEVGVQTIDVNDFLETMESAKSPINIVVLDACRNNPLNATRGGGGGLAPVNAPRGSYIAYATAPGAVAVDGDGLNSPYTLALADVLTTPGLKLEDVFKKTRQKVLVSTDEKQVPWETSSIVGDFYFKSALLTEAVATTTDEPADNSSGADNDPVVQSVPICKKNDKKIRVQSWQPSFKKDGTLKAEPPTGEGIIVYIKTAMDSSKVECGKANSDIFSIEFLNGLDRDNGGLAVNFPSASVQYVQGLCHISGFFMNKDVPGMHQGFIETYFEPVDYQKIVLSGNFCMKS